MKRKAVSLLLAGVMILGTSVTAMASTASDSPAKGDQPLDGQGYIAAEDEYTENDEDDDTQTGMIDVSVPANGFFWYANEDTKNVNNSFDIRSAKYEITNNSEKLNLQVSLLEYEDVTPSGNSNVIDPDDVTLKLEGDLAGDLVGDVSNTYIEDLLSSTNGIPAGGITYKNLLEAKETWEYSFTGTYNQAKLPDDALLSDYVITLELEVVSGK